MKLSILVCALENRNWQKVVNELKRQADEVGDVEVLVDLDQGESTSGIKRNRLMARATGEYICHADDDDWYDPEYVKLIVEGCNKGVDVVTFNLDMTYRTYEIWKFGLWPSSRSEGRMMVNHLCAWKADIARKTAFCPLLGYADDQVWFLPLFYAGLAKTEHHIDKILYHYIFDRTVTVNQQMDRRAFSLQYTSSGLRCFHLNGEIYIEVPSDNATNTGCVVRDRNNVERYIANVQSYFTIRIN